MSLIPKMDHTFLHYITPHSTTQITRQLMCSESVYALNTHHRYMEWSHGTCNTYCGGGCGFPYDSMHIGEFATAVFTALIPVHQVK